VKAIESTRSSSGLVARLVTVNERVGLAAPLTILIAAYMFATEQRFAAGPNIFNILRDFSVITLAALGQTLVLITGRFDLSVGAVVALVSVAAAAAMHYLQMLFPGMDALVVGLGAAAALLIGLGVGFCSGWLIWTLRLDSFIATIGVSSIILGCVYVWTYGVPVAGVPDLLTKWLGRGRLFGLPPLFLIAVAAVGVIWFVLEKTPLGRHAFAVGSNEAAARVAGISPGVVVCAVFSASGLFAAIVSLYLTARVGSGQSAFGTNMAMQAITAAVVGGVSLQGGSGSALKVALGGLFLAVLGNALNLARIDSKLQVLVFGIVLIAAALLDRASGRTV
jgi:ribose transport system permease protein